MTANTMRLIVNRHEADAIRAGLQMIKTRDLRGGFPKDTLVDVITMKKSLCKLSNEKIDELCDLLDFEKSGSHSNDDLASVMENILAKYLEHGLFVIRMTDPVWVSKMPNSVRTKDRAKNRKGFPTLR